MHCLCVDPAHVAKIWPMVTHLIREAMERGGGDYTEVEAATLSGEKLLWLAVDEQAIWAAAVTGLHVEKAHKFCCIWACGGKERTRWLDMESLIEKYAKDEGCQSMRIYGRRGWAKEFPDYKLKQIMLEKVL